MSGLRNVSDHLNLIRSKNAGPFMLTLDLFFVDSHSREAFLRSGVLDPAFIAELYGVDPGAVQRWDLPDIDAVKISFPRRVPSGEFGDTDITGGQQYALLVEAIAALEITGDGTDLAVSLRRP